MAEMAHDQRGGYSRIRHHIGDRQRCGGLIVIGLMMLGAATASQHLDIGVWGSGDSRCRVEFHGKSYILPEARSDLQTALLEGRKQADWLHITNDMTTPWRCMGEVMTLGAKAKFKKVGFISEPPQ
ncbi:hypothetical protein HL653_20170 [Sphingomonas sp. AP4-R1]|uniref:hypothetical protein n=1 Tax=Sphingomonas sp. AP4-R1 TaxID=2735134 RepID=UPI001493B568|nr:hypothetical protein [Sphingomonas sp. AP4-R1]QJU59759.1 hypothetical protein HL653_20170 [Sphingomonas sp. AP4-R1]